MINVSTSYQNALNNYSFNPKSKIIVDGKEYLGNVIKTFPKISHKSSFIVGMFPAKTLNIEIYDLENNITLENKEIIVYKGLVVDGEIEYVKQGIFIPKAENIETNISNRIVTLRNVQDRTQYLENIYETELDYSSSNHTGLEIVQEICTKRNIELANTNFAFANYLFSQPNFNENTTDREVIARLSEIGGEIALFNNEGKLIIKKQNQTNITISRKRYQSLSKEKTVTYNTIALGNKGMQNYIVYPETIDGNRVTLEILDNPFVDLIKQDIIEEVANNIIGLAITPYKLNGFVDGYMFELNDVISVIDRNGEILNAVILEIEDNSRIRSNVKLDNNLINKVDYKLAGSNRKELDKVKLEVDHNSKEIRSLVSKTSDIESSVELLKAELDTNNVIIQVDDSNKPYETTNYDVGYKVFYLSKEIELIPTTENTATGITTEITKDYIRFKVNKTTQIPNIDNKFTFTFSYTKDGKTYTLSKTIVVSILTSKTGTVPSDTEPEDKTVMWFDTSTNTLKRYDGEEWIIVNDFSNDINSINENLNNLSSSTKQDIQNLGAEITNTQETIQSQLTQISEGWEMMFSNLEQTLNNSNLSATEQLNEIKKYIRFSNGNIILGQVGNEHTLKIENDRIGIYYNGKLISSWIKDAVDINELHLGKFAFIPRENGSLSFRKVVD